MSRKTSIIISFLLVTIGVMARILPHAPNVTPITAIALFATAYLGLRYAVAIIFATMVMTDIWIGTYDWRIMLAVYAGVAIVGLIGIQVRKNITVLRTLFGALTASVIFFIITNAAVWAFTPMYARDLAGLMQSYTMAIPFFKNSLLGDLGYTAILFGALELVKYLAQQRARQVLPITR